MKRKVTVEPISLPSPRGRKLIVGGAAAGGVLLIAWLTVYLIRLPDTDLNRVSDVGQAFGIVSAIFSAAALAGVAASVAYQSRQNRYYRYETWHTAQTALLSFVIEEPAIFGPCVVDVSRFESDEEIRRYFFTTLWLNFAQIGFRSGNFTEESIRDELCGEMFGSPVARRLWAKRRSWNTERHGGLTPFRAIVDDEFQKWAADAFADRVATERD